MFKWKEFEKTKQVLSHVGGNRYKDEWGQHHLYVRPNTLLDWMEFIKEDLGFFTMNEIAANGHADFDHEIVYNLLNMGTHQRLNIHLLANKSELIPSVVKYFSHAEWLEREQAGKYKLKLDVAKFEDRPLQETIPPLRFNPNKSEAPYPEESYQWKFYDLLSPETLGHFEWALCFDPVKVVDSRIRTGFHHQGIEELLHNKDIVQIIQLADKINLSSAPNYSVAWTKTIEEMYRIKIPERAQAIRIVMLELARVADHLTVMATICFEGKLDEHRLFINAREKIYELFEKFSGHRHGLGVTRIGGVKEDLPHGWIVEYQNVAEVISKTLKVIHNSLISKKNFREMLDGEPLNAQSVIQWGVSGPAMRAAGLNFDLRKSQPFYFYQDIDFDIPVGIHGTGYDRYLIRLEEIFQSMRITTQVIDNLPLGEVVSSLFDKNYLELHKVFETLEKPLQWHYSSLESPAGEAGFLVKIEDGLKPSRIKIKTPGLCIAQALPEFMKGLRAEQLRTNLASLGISRWEMDR